MATRGNEKKGKVDESMLRRVAQGLAVDEGVLQNAVAKQKLSFDEFIKRTDQVRRDLAYQLGGDEMLQAWLRTENGGLDGKQPVELLEEGRIDVLERIEKALKGLQFG